MYAIASRVSLCATEPHLVVTGHGAIFQRDGGDPRWECIQEPVHHHPSGVAEFKLSNAAASSRECVCVCECV